jgi:23S rRNA (cytosine1962-C5)-methyltransferase
MTTEAAVIIRPDRVSMFEKRHPWVFSGAIQAVQDDPADGDVVALRAGDGTFLARGYWNRQSQIRVHVLTWDENQPVDEAFWRSRLARAIAARPAPADPTHAAYRLVNAESDLLPGLIVDQYGEYLVMQALTLGIDQRKSLIAELLMDLQPGVRGVYERSDVDVRGKEGLGSSTGRLAGEEPPLFIEVQEHTYRFLVDVRSGHKTGFYLDQSPNRKKCAEALTQYGASGKTMLNCFCYTGGFTLAAMGAGVSSTSMLPPRRWPWPGAI